MAFAENLIATVETLLDWLSRGLKQTGPDYCEIEAVDDEHTFTLQDGTLLTVLRLHGSYRMMGEAEFAEVNAQLSKSLQAYLSTGGHAVQCFSVVTLTLLRRLLKLHLRLQEPPRSDCSWI